MIDELRRKLEQCKGKRNQILSDIESYEADVASQKRELIKHEQALEIMKTVELKMFEQIQFHISDITSLALEAVFDNPYELQLEFVERRNKTECDIYFTRDGKKINPLNASGGGAVDVAAFALRIASWSLNVPHSRPVMILDEPLKWVSEEYKERAAEMVKQVSEKLGIQIIMVTHEQKLSAMADKVFEIKIRKGISKIV